MPAVVYVATAMPEPGVVSALRPRRPRHRRARARPRGPRWRAPPGAGRPVRDRRRAGAHLARRDGRALVEADGELRLQRHLRHGAGAVRRDGGDGRRSASCSTRSSPKSWRSPRPKASTCRCALARGDGRIAAAMPAQLSSTAQDMARGKPSEIDHLNGFVARRGRELGMPRRPTRRCMRSSSWSRGRGRPMTA